MHGIRLMDGRVIKSPTWEGLERAWNDDFMNAIAAPENFRKEIQNRAKQWSGADIAIDGDGRDFLFECERGGLLTVIVDADNAVDTPPVKSLPHIVFEDAKRARMEARKG